MCRYRFNPYIKDEPDWSDPLFAFLQNEDMMAFHQSLDGYQPTPLVSLVKTAACLGVKEILVKDESHRFGLNAFKALGASYAIYRFLKEKWEAQFSEVFDTSIFHDPVKLTKLGSFTFCAATDGNHGRAVAWTAKKLQQKAVIYMPSDTVPARIEDIRKEGAQVVIVDGTYDDCVTVAAKDAKEHGWFEIADTAYEGYTTIPSWVLNGYSTIFHEVESEMQEKTKSTFDFVVLQVGVGAFAAAGAAYYTKHYGNQRPQLVCVEPLEAAGFLDSIEDGQGKPIPAKGQRQTIMAGLNCGTPSLVAWPILRDSVKLFLAITDSYAEEAMKQYANEGIISGEAGASGLAALTALIHDPLLRETKKTMGLGAHCRILLINTEGDTDPENYHRIVGIDRN